jgi:hypothetical protein
MDDNEEKELQDVALEAVVAAFQKAENAEEALKTLAFITETGTVDEFIVNSVYNSSLKAVRFVLVELLRVIMKDDANMVLKVLMLLEDVENPTKEDKNAE